MPSSIISPVLSEIIEINWMWLESISPVNWKNQSVVKKAKITEIPPNDVIFFSPGLEIWLELGLRGNLIKNKVMVKEIIKARRYPIIKISPGIGIDWISFNKVGK